MRVDLLTEFVRSFGSNCVRAPYDFEAGVAGVVVEPSSPDQLGEMVRKCEADRRAVRQQRDRLRGAGGRELVELRTHVDGGLRGRNQGIQSDGARHGSGPSPCAGQRRGTQSLRGNGVDADAGVRVDLRIADGADLYPARQILCPRIAGRVSERLE